MLGSRQAIAHLLVRWSSPIGQANPCHAEFVERVLDELDNQEVHLRRLARRIDALKPAGSDLELQVSRRLHVGLEEIHAAWGDDAPPGWPDLTTKMVSRVGPHRWAIEFLAERVDDMGGGALKDEIHGDLNQGRARMPIKLESQFHETPLVVPPEAIERDFYELIFNPQQEALLKIDSAVDELERRHPSS